ncbi:CDP-alcohol phosphatidyltransferase family protein [Nocardioides sp. JQ2195]|uniref:CDP-alcohol phosphatidyltransferase family protein n=1 Tax=Nocardioides sp. JQ2195 TaxID=2592334 RepID=UPI001980042B|nr:CDP-alcohol phosphatidyltransferase family protein [Nocardioides sp. JQ2195]
MLAGRLLEEELTRADLVTGSRFVLAAALAVAAASGGPRWLIAALAAAALLTDFVDGRLARATGTVTALGARLDAEADAVLILVLSAIVASDQGWWVLGIGLARYAFGLLFWAVPKLSTPPLRARPWNRVVAATVGITLAAVAGLSSPGLAIPGLSSPGLALPGLALPGSAAGGLVIPGLVIPELVARVALIAVAVLLAESFLHETVDRWRSPRPGVTVRFGTLVALAACWIALSAPALAEHGSVSALFRLPVEVVVVLALALVPLRRLRTGLAAVAGALLAILLLVKVLNWSFTAVLDRDFDPIGDWSLLGPGIDVLGDSIGIGWARVVAVLAAVGVLLVLVGLPLAVVRLVQVARDLRPRPFRAVAVVVTVGLLCAAAGVPVVGAGTTALAISEVALVRANVADHRAFARAIADDPLAARAASDPRALLAGLQGKDVLVVFVESYGRVAVQDTTYSHGINRVLDSGTKQLTAAGYRSRSAFMTSPTFGAGSWLAHATLQSGLWVDSQTNYRQLLGAERMTLTSLFGAAGWETVFDVPADTEDWPEGQDFYGFEQYADSRNVDYAGPKLGYAPVPDQYTLEHFRRTFLAPTDRRPVMAEIDLVSSHHPWTPLPRMVPWRRIGDGSIYHHARGQGPSAGSLPDAATIRRMYGQSIEYSWRALTSFLTTYPDPNLVLVVVGDHQPHSYVSGDDVGHDVPISVIAQDPAVLRRIAGWRWEAGLRPAPDAVVWPMDAFRDRFLAAFSR